MPRITMEEQKEFGVFPVDSILLLKIDSIETREITGRDGGTWEKLNFTFRVIDVQVAGDGTPKEELDDMIGERIYGNVPFRFTSSPENRLRQWVEAIMGMELGVGFELDTDLLVGRTVRGITGQYEKKTKNPATGKNYRGHQIESLLPAKAGTAAPAQAQQGFAPAPVQAAPQPAFSTTGWDDPPF